MTNINRIETAYIPTEEAEHDNVRDEQGSWEPNYEEDGTPAKRSHGYRRLGPRHSKKHKAQGYRYNAKGGIDVPKRKMTTQRYHNKFRKQHQRYPSEYREYDYGQMKRQRRAIAKRPGVSFEDEDDILSQDSDDKLRVSANPEEDMSNEEASAEIPEAHENVPLRTYNDNEQEERHHSSAQRNALMRSGRYFSKDVTDDKPLSKSQQSRFIEDERGDMFDVPKLKNGEIRRAFSYPENYFTKVSHNLKNRQDQSHAREDVQDMKPFASNRIPEQEKEDTQPIMELPLVSVTLKERNSLQNDQLASPGIVLTALKSGRQNVNEEVRHARKGCGRTHWSELVNDLILQKRNYKAKKIDKNNKKYTSKRKVYEKMLMNKRGFRKQASKSSFEDKFKIGTGKINKRKTTDSKTSCSRGGKEFQLNIIKPMIVEVKYPEPTDHHIYERSAGYYNESEPGSSKSQSDNVAISENKILQRKPANEETGVSVSDRGMNLSRSGNVVESGDKKNSFASGEIQGQGGEECKGGIRKGRKLLSEEERNLSAFSSGSQDDSYSGKTILSELGKIWSKNKNKSLNNANAKFNSEIARNVVDNEYVGNPYAREEQNVIGTSVEWKSMPEDHLKDSSVSNIKLTNNAVLTDFPKALEANPLKESEEKFVSSQSSEQEGKRSLPHYNRYSTENTGTYLFGEKVSPLNDHPSQKNDDERNALPAYDRNENILSTTNDKIDENENKINIFSGSIQEKYGAPQLGSSFSDTLTSSSTEKEITVNNDLGLWGGSRISDTKNENSVQGRSTNISFPQTIKELFDEGVKKPANKYYKTNSEHRIKSSFGQPITKPDNQFQRHFTQNNIESTTSELIKPDNQIQRQPFLFDTTGTLHQSPTDSLRSDNKLSDNIPKTDTKATKPDYQFSFSGVNEKKQPSLAFQKSDNQFQGLNSNDQLHSKASGNADDLKKNYLHSSLQLDNAESSIGMDKANVNSSTNGQQKMANLRISPSEYSDVSQMRPTISGDLASEILDDIFVKVNSSIRTKHHIGDALTRTDYTSSEAGASEIGYKLQEGDFTTRCTKVLQEVSRLITCLVSQEVKKKSCVTLEPDLQDFLSWMLEPEASPDIASSDQDNFIFNRNEGNDANEENDEDDDEDEEGNEEEDDDDSDKCQKCKKINCRSVQCDRCKFCRNVKTRDIDRGIKQLNALLSEYDRLSNYEKSKLQDLQGILSKKLVELHSFLRTDVPASERVYEANVKHEMQKYQTPLADNTDFAQIRRQKELEPIQVKYKSTTTESVLDSKLIDEQLVKLGLYPGKKKNANFNPTSEPTEEYEHLARKVDEYRRKRKVMYNEENQLT
ncbi:hypothetical protein C0J52_13138 [Blattella germanica]|nr:hypothetical protein C0J52_13138 [Blattella germanica]